MAQGLQKILTDEDLHTQLTEKGFERVKQFSWEETAHQIMQVFEKNDRRS